MCESGISESDPALFECPLCNGKGCKQCQEGQFAVTQCGRVYIREIARATTIATLADKGFLPLAGGLMDQSAWFLDFWVALKNDQNIIDQEQLDRWRTKM